MEYHSAIKRDEQFSYMRNTFQKYHANKETRHTKSDILYDSTYMTFYYKNSRKGNVH